MRGRRWAAALGVVVLALTGCSGEDEPPPPAAAPTIVQPSATPAPVPTRAGCYRLRAADALAPTSVRPAVPCRGEHTSATYAVGTLDLQVNGHLVAVDSDRAQAQVARACPRRFPGHVGGSEDDRRLSMLRPVWFTPTLEEADAGAAWFRCDVIALAAEDELAPLAGTAKDVLSSPEGRDRYGMCGTAAPDAADFAHVVCSSEHAWRAISVVPIEGTTYPGEEAVRAAGETLCEDAGRERADDPLDFTWGYEWPSQAQWRTGQRYGRCWVPV